MKCITPEIAWHNKDPILSMDIQPVIEGSVHSYRLATGGYDSHVLIWCIEDITNSTPIMECVCDLTRHQRAVNIVRFSPTSNLLASADDESIILIWRRKNDADSLDANDIENSEFDNKEQWTCMKTLRLHTDDIYDIAWSPDSTGLISGSVDNTAIIWDLTGNDNKDVLRGHRGFVQGVAWDPLDKYVVTLGSDRVMRVFELSNKKLFMECSKGSAFLAADSTSYKPLKLFHDDTLKSYCRRVCFSPDGMLLAAPCGLIESTTNSKPTNTTLIFLRDSFSQPIMHLPSGAQYSVAVKFSPMLFKLRKPDTRMKIFDLPYRMILAVATKSSVMLYDTECTTPFALVTNIHYTRLTDIAWSSDSKFLMVSSTDGYCTLISFVEGELGIPYVEP